MSGTTGADVGESANGENAEEAARAEGEAMSWLTEVVNDGGEFCRNCSTPECPVWRQLYGRELEQCPECEDAKLDVCDFAEDDPY